ncbi:MAG: hypothetical protein N2691_00430 [Patescibacteria group bacterium]|nr:hypothetical protein [Patescibacteria group bacterium]
MQRITDIFTGLLQFLAQLAKRFFVDLGYAVYFWVMEYDDKLRSTKTPTQRILIWAGIVVGVLAGAALILNGAYHLISNLNIGTYEPASSPLE